MKVLSIFTLIVYFSQSSAGNLCEHCVQNGDIFVLTLNYEPLCLNLTWLENIEVKTTHETQNSCGFASMLIKKRGSTSSKHQFYLPVSMVQLSSSTPRKSQSNFNSSTTSTITTTRKYVINKDELIAQTSSISSTTLSTINSSTESLFQLPFKLKTVENYESSTVSHLSAMVNNEMMRSKFNSSTSPTVLKTINNISVSTNTSVPLAVSNMTTLSEKVGEFKSFDLTEAENITEISAIKVNKYLVHKVKMESITMRSLIAEKENTDDFVLSNSTTVTQQRRIKLQNSSSTNQNESKFLSTIAPSSMSHQTSSNKTSSEIIPQQMQNVQEHKVIHPDFSYFYGEKLDNNSDADVTMASNFPSIVLNIPEKENITSITSGFKIQKQLVHTINNQEKIIPRALYQSAPNLPTSDPTTSTSTSTSTISIKINHQREIEKIFFTTPTPFSSTVLSSTKRSRPWQTLPTVNSTPTLKVGLNNIAHYYLCRFSMWCKILPKQNSKYNFMRKTMIQNPLNVEYRTCEMSKMEQQEWKIIKNWSPERIVKRAQRDICNMFKFNYQNARQDVHKAFYLSFLANSPVIKRPDLFPCGFYKKLERKLNRMEL